MVIGARQVGKTYIIKEFCRHEFDNTLVFNLYERPEIVNIFQQEIPTQQKINRLELLIGQKIDFENTLIFFDEVQESEELISALKFFAESETSYKIICAGSLLGVKVNRFKKSFPVGKVHMTYLQPMDFEEYLWASDEELLADEIRRCFSLSEPIAEPLHDKLLDYYRRYLCIGGMPEALADLIRHNQDVLLTDPGIREDINASYLNDMNKYVTNERESIKIEAIYRSIPAQLGNTGRKFRYSTVRKGARSRDYMTALDWLISSNMIQVSTSVESPLSPLIAYENQDHFKVFFNDVGLLTSALGISFKQIMLDEPFAYKGAIAENYVANQLTAAKIPLRYWRLPDRYEVDFLLDEEGQVAPVEVKAGSSKKSSSFNYYRKEYNPPVSYRIRQANFGEMQGVKSIPLYAVHCLSALISSSVK